MTGGEDSSFGVSHLSNLPITLTFGGMLLVVLVVLILLRVVFGEITVSGGAKG